MTLEEDLGNSREVVHIVAFFFIASPETTLGWWKAVYPENRTLPALLVGEANSWGDKPFPTTLVTGAMSERAVRRILYNKGAVHSLKRMVLKSWSGYNEGTPLMSVEEYQHFSDFVPTWDGLAVQLSLALPVLDDSVHKKVLDIPDKARIFYDTVLRISSSWVGAMLEQVPAEK